MSVGEKYRKHLEFRVNEYAPQVHASILTNSHMNEYVGETFNNDIMARYLTAIVDRFCTDYEGGPSNGDVVYGLLDAARKHYMSSPKPYTDATVKAVIVDFLNFVAMHVGMDFGLYTSDF